MLLALVLACSPAPLSGIPLEVPDTCHALVDDLDTVRLTRDIEHLAASPRASDARRAETRAWLVEQLAEAGVPAREAPFTIAGQSGVNVTAGSGPILVAAHYDSTADTPGADDNASGVAVALAVARTLGPRVRYAFFDVEEPRRATVGSDGRNYALGSQAYVDTLADGEVKVAPVLESVGYACDDCQRLPPGVPASAVPRDGRAVYLVGSEASSTVLPTVASAFARLAKPVPAHPFAVPGTGLGLPQSRFSDNAPLWDEGIAAILVTDTALLRNPSYHRSSDVPETLDVTLLDGVARGTIVAAAALAGACGTAPAP